MLNISLCDLQSAQDIQNGLPLNAVKGVHPLVLSVNRFLPPPQYLIHSRVQQMSARISIDSKSFDTQLKVLLCLHHQQPDASQTQDYQYPSGAWRSPTITIDLHTIEINFHGENGYSGELDRWHSALSVPLLPKHCPSQASSPNLQPVFQPRAANLKPFDQWWHKPRKMKLVTESL